MVEGMQYVRQLIKSRLSPKTVYAPESRQEDLESLAMHAAPDVQALLTASAIAGITHIYSADTELIQAAASLFSEELKLRTDYSSTRFVQKRLSDLEDDIELIDGRIDVKRGFDNTLVEMPDTEEVQALKIRRGMLSRILKAEKTYRLLKAELRYRNGEDFHQPSASENILLDGGIDNTPTVAL